MANVEPVTELDSGFSSDDALPTTWFAARDGLEQAQVFWLSTVRPDGRPPVTTLLAVWRKPALYFCTGRDERKARNLAQNPNCVLTAGHGALEGLDLVVEGRAVSISDRLELRNVADACETKCDGRFTEPTGTRFGLGDQIRRGDALVYRVAPVTAFGFAKDTFGQTCWRFPQPNWSIR
jgi:uncharacterized pyridoxamine 5'-phosphate oxidase family protein